MVSSVTSSPSVPPVWSNYLQALVDRAASRRYRKGTLLIQEGDVGEMLFIVLSGRVKAFSTDERDREVIYGVYGPGEYLGEMSLDGGPRSASVMALESTTCAVVTRSTLREHIAAYPEFAFELLDKVVRRARLATQGMRDMALLDVYERLVGLLEGLAAPQPDGQRILHPRPTHAEIANRIGCSREMVSRLMKDLMRGGYVSQEGRTWTLLQRLPPRW